jgi:hypothetical protein
MPWWAAWIAVMAYTAAFGHLVWAMGSQLQAGVRSWLEL